MPIRAVVGPKSAGTGQAYAKLGPKSAQSWWIPGQCRQKSVDVVQALIRLFCSSSGAVSAHVRPTLARAQPNVGRFRPRSWPDLGKVQVPSICAALDPECVVGNVTYNATLRVAAHHNSSCRDVAAIHLSARRRLGEGGCVSQAWLAAPHGARPPAHHSAGAEGARTPLSSRGLFLLLHRRLRGLALGSRSLRLLPLPGLLRSLAGKTSSGKGARAASATAGGRAAL